jgi:hypothetical protein
MDKKMSCYLVDSEDGSITLIETPLEDLEQEDQISEYETEEETQHLRANT